MSNPLSTKPRHILVLGTVAYEVGLIPGTPPLPAKTTGLAAPFTYRKRDDWVGAPIIREMISQALDSPTSPSRVHPDQPPIPEPGAVQPAPASTAPLGPFPGVKEECGELTTVFARFPRTSARKKDDLVWRVRQNYRAEGSMAGHAEHTAYWKACIDNYPAPEVVVIYEQDRKFQAALRRLEAGKTKAAVLIVALAEEADSESIVQARRVFQPDDTIVLVTSDALRRKGLNVVAYGSIERTVLELSARLGTAPLTKIFDRKSSHLIVLFEEIGAVCIRRRQRTNYGSVHFCPHFDRVAQMEKDDYGRVPGRMALALTSVARSVDEWLEAGRRSPGPDVDAAMRLAVVAYNQMFDSGFDEGDPFATVKGALSRDRIQTMQSAKPPKEFFLSSLHFETKPETLERWSRLDDVEGSTDFAARIVIEGVEAACLRQPPAGSPPGSWPEWQIACPFMQVGKIQSFDSAEIERYADLLKLMRKYVNDEGWTTPLSMAVFGPPGAGKSFAVKQLMRMVNPAIKDSSILTFNLAQFDSLELLTEAFHQVQDQSLTSGEVPLVIFDEFDSSFQQTPRGWLKYFLAPMEDGVFRGRTSNYKVGRAVFLFAGGTAHSFREFTSALDEQRAAKKRSRSQRRSGAARIDDTPAREAKAAKLPDFVSRLMAYLDILGINAPTSPQQPETESDVTRRRVRRATLLRSLLEEFAEPIFRLDKSADVMPPIVDAFLDDRVRYRNEARSMKALVRESRWIGNQFLVASLPSRPLIELHTEKWPFRALSAVGTLKAK